MQRGWQGASSLRPPTTASVIHPSSRAAPFQSSIKQVLVRAFFLHAKRMLTLYVGEKATLSCWF